MRRLFPIALAAAVLIALGAGLPARAQDSQDPERQDLIIGTVRVLTLRAGDTLNGREWSIQDRIDHIQDLFAKYLGGYTGKVTSKPVGARVHLYLNGEFVLAVTPADARATGYRTAAQLAPKWAAALRRGFEEARVHAVRPAAPDNSGGGGAPPR